MLSDRVGLALLPCVGAAFWIGPAVAAAAPFGNDVFLGNSTTGLIDDTQDRRAQLFTAPMNMTVDRVHFQFNSVVGAPELQLAIQSDNGSGIPNGTDLAVASFTGIGGQTGYTVNLNAPLALTGGTKYHIVARATSAAAGTNTAALRLLASTPSVVNTLNPAGLQGVSVGTSASTNGGSTYSTNANGTTIWGLSNSTTGQAISQAYSTMQITNFGGNPTPGGNATWAGQRFKYTGSSGTLDSLQIQLRRTTAGTPSLSDDLRVHIVEVATQEPGTPTGGSTAVTSVVPGDVVYSGVLLTAGSAVADSPGAFYSLDIPTANEPDLISGQSYLMVFETNSLTHVTLPFDQGSDTLSNVFGGASLNFQNMDDGFVVTSSESLVNGLPARFFTSDSIGTSRIYRDARFLLNVVPEPSTIALAGIIGMASLVRRRPLKRG